MTSFMDEPVVCIYRLYVPDSDKPASRRLFRPVPPPVDVQRSAVLHPGTRPERDVIVRPVPLRVHRGISG